MKTRFLLITLLLSISITCIFQASVQSPFYLLVHTQGTSNEWIQNLEVKFKARGFKSAGNISANGWLLIKPDIRQRFTHLSINPAESQQEVALRIKNAIVLLERKFKTIHDQIEIIHAEDSKPFVTEFIKAPGKLEVSLVASSIEKFEATLQATNTKIDDWVYESEFHEYRYSKAKTRGVNAPLNGLAGGVRAKIAAKRSAMPAPISRQAFKSAAFEQSADHIGFSVGGAKDIGNFRENIRSGFLPKPSDLTYEGLFYDYFFETNPSGTCSQLFCPAYTKAISKDPFSMEEEYYLAVGLNSGMKASDFKRKRLNLVIVLDISGSMASPFNRYHHGSNRGIINMPKEASSSEEEDWNSTKLEIATRSITYLFKHLEPTDRLAFVVFDDRAEIAKPFRMVKDTDMKAIKAHILELKSRGGTNMSAGMQAASEQFDALESDPKNEENRIIFLTDAMPNQGELSPHGLLGMVEKNAARKVHTTMIGIGVDFQTELVEKITKARGANYYAVHSSSAFKRRMDEEFNFMVSPLIFDLTLRLASEGYEIEKVYGAPEAEGSTAEILKIHTLFPSKQEDGEVKGGLILIKLKSQKGKKDIKLMVSYEDVEGNLQGNSVDIKFEPGKIMFENNGIRKGILLTKYADLMQNWILDERAHPTYEVAFKPSLERRTGICKPRELSSYNLGRWEHTSMKLKVSDFYQTLFKDFQKYYKQEMKLLKDENLQQELKILTTLAYNWSDKSIPDKYLGN